MSDVVIRVENLYKEYKLGVISHGTLTHDLQSWWARVRGKEDPNSLISTNPSAAAETGSFLALKDINFEVKAGDRVGIIGKNGAGKSTLLKILSKVTAPTKGQVKMKGRVGSLLEVGTGFHSELTGRENIYLNGAILGMRKKEIDRKLDEIVDFAGVEKHIDTPVKRYSSGMNVRLGFAVAAHLEPEILIVDEVLAVGDAEFQKKAIGKMEDVSKGEGRTILFVSHNMAAVQRLCNIGIVIKNGSFKYHGFIDEAVNKYIGEQEERSKLSLFEVDRNGNGTLRFIDIQFVDREGRIKDTFEVGEELNIILDFVAKDSFYASKSSRIDIGINNLFNIRVLWLSSFIFQDKIENKNRICFNIPNIYLTEGVYNLNLYSETIDGMTDWVQNVAQLNIVFNDYYKTGRKIPEKQGLIVMDYKVI
ncbi:MAG: ABC transporter ATP-binding protein [Spirochaetota bacterium]